MKNGSCPKCGSNDLLGPRPLRGAGEGLMITSCNQCRFSELYTPDAVEKSAHDMKVAMVWLFAVILPIAVTIWMVWFPPW